MEFLYYNSKLKYIKNLAKKEKENSIKSKKISSLHLKNFFVFFGVVTFILSFILNGINYPSKRKIFFLKNIKE